MKKKAPKKNPATKKVQATKPTQGRITTAQYRKRMEEKFTPEMAALIELPDKLLRELEARVRKLELYSTANVDSWIEQITNRLTKLESPAPPAEKEDPLKVGDWVVALPVDQRTGSLGGMLDIGSAPIRFAGCGRGSAWPTTCCYGLAYPFGNPW